MIGTRNFWVNTISAILFIGLLLGIYYVIKDAKIEVAATVWIGVASIVTGLLITMGNRYNDKIRKDVDAKASRDEMNIAINAVIKRIDDHRDDDKQKYDTLNEIIKETNIFVRQILTEMTKNKKK